MPAIFISYRREDSRAVTRALASELAARFGDDMIFLDVDAIEAGVDFSQTILDALRAASVVLVIIGPRWLTSTGDLADSRLPEPNDFVRLEIETAQQWGAPIIPVLVSGAEMPEASSLPESIRSLALNNAFTVQDTSAKEDTNTLADKIEISYAVEPLPNDARSYLGGRLAVLRRYPLLLGRLLRRPKRTLATRALGRTRDLVDAMLFLTLSTALAVWLMIAEWPGKSWELWISGISVGLIAVLLFSAPLYLSWRLVGAKPDYGRVFTILCYQTSVLHFVVGFAGLLLFMAFNLTDPNGLQQFRAALKRSGVGSELKEATNALLSSPAWNFAVHLIWIVPLLMLAWYVLSWGAYRRSLGSGRLRSGLAFVLSSAIMLAPFIALMLAAIDFQ